MSATRLPGWSQIDGTWRPVSRSEWAALGRSAGSPDLEVRFLPGSGAGKALDRTEYFLVRSRSMGAHRLFAACPNQHYDSLAVAWIDVIVRPVHPTTYCNSAPASRTFERDAQGC